MHPLAEVDRLVDVVGDEQDGDAELAATAADEILQVGAGLRVDGGERLVHQQHLRLVRDGAGDRHALLHAAGELPRVGLARVGETDRVQRVGRPAPSPRPCGSFFCCSGSSTLSRTVIQGNRLRPYSWKTTAIPGGGPVDRRAVQATSPPVGVEQAGDALQQRRLAAAGRADDADEFARVDGEGEVAQRLDAAAATRRRPSAGRGRRASDVSFGQGFAAGPGAGRGTRPAPGARRAGTAATRAKPSSPSSRMPVHISGMAKLRWNWTMVKPRPLLAANISLITIRMIADGQRLAHAGDDLRAAPRAAPGAAAASGPRDAVGAAVSPQHLSTARTPSTVLSRIGHTQPLTITDDLHGVADAREQHDDRHQHRRRDGPEELQHRLQHARARRRYEPMTMPSADAERRPPARSRPSSRPGWAATSARSRSPVQMSGRPGGSCAAAGSRSWCCRRSRATRRRPAARAARGRQTSRSSEDASSPPPPRAPTGARPAPGAPRYGRPG